MQSSTRRSPQPTSTYVFRILASLTVLYIFSLGLLTLVHSLFPSQQTHVLDRCNATNVDFTEKLGQIENNILKELESEKGQLQQKLDATLEQYQDLKTRFEKVKADLDHSRSQEKTLQDIIDALQNQLTQKHDQVQQQKHLILEIQQLQQQQQQHQQPSQTQQTGDSNNVQVDKIRGLIQNELATERAIIDGKIAEIAKKFVNHTEFSARVESVQNDIEKAKKEEERQLSELINRAIDREQSRQCSTANMKNDNDVVPRLSRDRVTQIVQEYVTLHISDRPIWLENKHVITDETNLLDDANIIEPTTPALTNECMAGSDKKNSANANSGFGSVLDFISFLSPVPARHSHAPHRALTRPLGPGDCWGICGAKATLTLELKSPAIPQHIVLEHIPAYQVNSVDSAPRLFSVTAYPSISAVSEKKGESLGTFEFIFNKSNTTHVQLYKANPVTFPVSAIQLEILSNNGNPVFTCLYRVRVFGSYEKKEEQK